eukprot:3365133-Prorocentrum_lima.AAC.1
MTSSLVGSEMCIRDSPRARPGIVAHRRRPSCPTPIQEGTEIIRLWGPVSYTHLTLPTICSV